METFIRNNYTTLLGWCSMDQNFKLASKPFFLASKLVQQIHLSCMLRFWHPSVGCHTERVLAGSLIRGYRWSTLHISGGFLLHDLRRWVNSSYQTIISIRELSCCSQGRLILPFLIELHPFFLQVLRSTLSFRSRLAAAFLVYLHTCDVQASQL